MIAPCKHAEKTEGSHPEVLSPAVLLCRRQIVETVEVLLVLFDIPLVLFIYHVRLI